MHRKWIQLIIPMILGGVLLTGCSKNHQADGASGEQAQYSASEAQVTFIELGSVNCVPCRMMQPVMASVDQKYGDQLQVIFYDVWTQEERHYAQQYGIRVIPTQVFLDRHGQEIYRHEGFFPEEELDRFLQAQGLVVQSARQEG